MDMKERIRHLCKLNHVSMNKVEGDLGFGKGYLSKLGTSKPNAEKLKKIADYFGYTDTMLVAAINEKLCNPYKNYYMLIPEIKILNKAVNTSYTLGYDASSLVANLKENF